MKFRIIIGSIPTWPYEIQYKENNSIFKRWHYVDMLKTLDEAEDRLNNLILNGYKPPIKLTRPHLGKVMKIFTEADILIMKLKGRA